MPPWSALCPVGEEPPLFLTPSRHLSGVESPRPLPVALHQGDGWGGHYAALPLLSAQVLTAPEADPRPLEVPGPPRVEGESSRLPCTPAVTLRRGPVLPGGGSGAPRPMSHRDRLPGSPLLLSPPAGRCQKWEHLGRKEATAEAVEWHQLPPATGVLPWRMARPRPSRWPPCLPQLVSESCPRLTFLKLSDCHGVTPDTLIMLARACPQLHSLDIQHSMVSSLPPRAPNKPGPRQHVLLCWVPRWNPQPW